MSDTNDKRSRLNLPLFSIFPGLNIEMVVFIGIVLLAIISRLYDLGDRVMSHDESLHVYYSWLYSIGQGYQHTPTTHGPLQFHLLALTYTLFGDNDFTARLPHAIASILTIAFLWKWKRFLGRIGMLVAAGFVLISPYMLYYGRYARNESFVALLGLLTLYAILRYLETGKKRHLLLLSAATALHFTVKETAFIYSAQALLFLSIYLINRVARLHWIYDKCLRWFIALLAIGVLFIGAALVLSNISASQPAQITDQTSSPLVPETMLESTSVSGYVKSVPFIIILALIAFIGASMLLIIGYGWKNLCRDRSFDMIILLGTFVLPQLSPLLIKTLGWNPLAYNFTWPGWNLHELWIQPPFKTAIVLLILLTVSITIGLAWNWKRWLVNAALFWGIYIFFFTSIFSNWAGLATGIVGSLGYWLEQQGVQRGNQPWYYYFLVQIPLYEYLPALGLGISAFYGLRKRSPASPPCERISGSDPAFLDAAQTPPTFGLLLFWALTSLLSFSLAGEKMPWLTVHITLPMILLSGWGLGQVIESLDRSITRARSGWAITLMITLIIGVIGLICFGLGESPPFEGKSLVQLTVTGLFIFSGLISLFSAGVLVYFIFERRMRNAFRVLTIIVFSLLVFMTIRTSVRAVYLYPNDASEYLVYAHGSSGVKDVMAEIENISSRSAGGQNLILAFDNSTPESGVAWPFSWYLRHYPNKIAFDQPGTDLLGLPVIIVDQKNYNSVETILGDDYYQFDYIRMVWPNQDYFNLTWARINDALTNPIMRTAIFKIWFSRDYSRYAEATGNTGMTLDNWIPSDKMKLYIRKDVALEIWDYSIINSTTVQADPYQQGSQTLSADLILGEPGTSTGQFNSPHGISVAPDGTLFVADTNNNRIQHFSAEGKFLGSWGSFGDRNEGVAPQGTFNQPWALAVSPDGEFIYVADTWNHRIQKFSTDGSPLGMWGIPLYDPSNNDPFGIWGPRGIVVDKQGRVFVADTGNKRIIIYDEDGNFLEQIGGEGFSIGQFEEPVGLAVDSRGYLLVADTWNQRVQIFAPSENGLQFSPYLQWEIAAWYGESLDNKPYLAVDDQGHVLITDPEAYRILEFTLTGEFIRSWGEYGIGDANFGLVSSISTDPEGHVWVTDAANNRLMRFTLP
jgi:predicted membrane-bound mannosyltransferase/sugar lactone lactonase YvrE